MSQIDRQSAIEATHKAIFDFFDICDDDKESPMTYMDEKLLEINKAITTRLKNLPSAQPEIIRCKDCRHLGTKKIFEGYYICPFTEKNVTHDDFCSFAERREE